MGSIKEIEEFLKNLQKRLKKEMPRIRKEIKVYEEKVAMGNLMKEPVPGQQFND